MTPFLFCRWHWRCPCKLKKNKKIKHTHTQKSNVTYRKEKSPWWGVRLSICPKGRFYKEGSYLKNRETSTEVAVIILRHTFLFASTGTQQLLFSIFGVQEFQSVHGCCYRFFHKEELLLLRTTDFSRVFTYVFTTDGISITVLRKWQLTWHEWSINYSI